MSNLAEHDEVGTLMGGLVALVLAARASQPGEGLDVLVQTLGGLVGGKLGSRLPDVIEPPTSSWHRSTAHSLAVTTAVGTVGVAKCDALAQQLRSAGRDARERAEQSPDSAASYEALRLLNNFLAGVVMGAPGGYVSHTLLDASTPRSIPFLTKGF